MTYAVETAISSRVSGAHALLMQRCSDLVVCLDQALTVIDINPIAEKLLRWPKSSTLNASFIDMCFSHGIAHPLPRGIQFNISGEFHCLADTTITHSNNDIKSIRWTVFPLPLDHHDQQGLMLIGHDVSKQRQAEAERDQLRRVIDQIPGMLYWKGKDFTYQGGNKAMLDVLDMRSEQELLGKTDFDCSWAHLADKYRRMDRQILEGHISETFYEDSYTIKDGLKSCLSYKAPLRNAQGDVEGVIGLAVDHTPMKETELNLRKELDDVKRSYQLGNNFIEKMGREVIGHVPNDPGNSNHLTHSVEIFLDTIMGQMPDMVHWKDRNSTYLGCNNAMAKSAGLASRHEIAGMSDRELAARLGLDASSIDQVLACEQEVFITGQPQSLEMQAVTAEGQNIMLHATKTPIRNLEGDIIGVFTVCTDISERKQYEQTLMVEKQKAEQASESKSSFLATMSHELRTPLNAIMGMTQILLARTHSADQRDYLQTIWQSSHSLLSLINDILDYSRMEAGELEVFSSPCNLFDIMSELEKDLVPQAEEKGISLTLHYAEQAPHTILGDATCIRQLLFNLIDNGIKFTHQGGVDVRVEIEESLAEGGATTANICVQDTGIGIPPDKLDSIFDRFTQIQSSYSGHFKGTGLGLAICKELVEAMGGEIHVDSTLGRGTRFWFTLPFAPVNKTPDPEASHPLLNTKLEACSQTTGISESRSRIPYRILLVEDNPLNQKIVTTMLHDLSYTVDLANNGRQALTLFQTQPYDLVFMDIGLPDMNGLKVISDMRRIEEPNAHLPIVALTAHMMENDLVKCLQAGADDALTKPLMLDALISILQKWVIDTPEQNAVAKHAK